MDGQTEHFLIASVASLLCLGDIYVFLHRLKLFLALKKRKFATCVGLSAIFTSVLFSALAIAIMFLTQSGNTVACDAAILTCVFLYTGTKAQLYVFFIERMHIVHKTPSQTRLTSRFNVFNWCLLLPYGVILVLMVTYRISFIDDSNDCRIGLGHAASLPLLIYDTLFSLYSVGVFVWPLLMMMNKSSVLLKVAKKNTIGSVISTFTSFLNILSITLFSATGEQCLFLCSFDVLVNVLVMNYLIGNGKRDEGNGKSSCYTPSENDGVSSVECRADRPEKDEIVGNRIVPLKFKTNSSVKESFATEDLMYSSNCTTSEECNNEAQKNFSGIEETLGDQSC